MYSKRCDDICNLINNAHFESFDGLISQKVQRRMNSLRSNDVNREGVLISKRVASLSIPSKSHSLGFFGVSNSFIKILLDLSDPIHLQGPYPLLRIPPNCQQFFDHLR